MDLALKNLQRLIRHKSNLPSEIERNSVTGV